jgi:hypothetical protein
MKWLQWPFLFFLGALDANTPLGRLLLVPVGMVCSAVAWPRIMFQLHVGDKADKNDLAKYCFGFTDPTLRFDREGSLNHRAIDFLVEWIRKAPQRAAKLGAFVILVLVGLAVLGWLV